MIQNPGNLLLKTWQRCQGIPGGKKVFQLVLKNVVPYSGTISPEVQVMEPGSVRVQMQDRRIVRNHLNSIHAIALANLAELSSGLAVVTALPEGYRGILKYFQVEYVKKARGRLESTCSVTLPLQLADSQTFDAKVEIRDKAGEVVTRAVATWQIGKNG